MKGSDKVETNYGSLTSQLGFIICQEGTHCSLLLNLTCRDENPKLRSVSKPLAFTRNFAPQNKTRRPAGRDCLI